MKNFIFIVFISFCFTMCGQNNSKKYTRGMTDKQQIIRDYKDMYSFMVSKDTLSLSKLMTEDFVLVHMTGMVQDKDTYLKFIANGTLNYFSATHENLDVQIDGDKATLTGQSKVTAAVFGGGKHTWNLQLKFWLIKQDGVWLQYKSQASTY